MLIYIQGGIPGVTPYASGPHIWGTRKGKTLELQGGTVDAMVENVKKQLPEKANLVGHDLGGLVALTVAHEMPERVRTVTAVASVAAAPSGDSVPNLTLAHPPQPLFSRESQRWALERVSYSHQHIDDALLDGCEQAAGKQKPVGDDFLPSLMAAKSKLYEVSRSRGFPVPAQVVWGTHDPLGTFDQGLWLFRLLAAKQKAVQFHVINRAGSLLFREEPEQFHQIVSAFVESA
jgi:2-hydroxy-6-oxonona-2,4-dienedioate hydrolase